VVRLNPLATVKENLTVQKVGDKDVNVMQEKATIKFLESKNHD